MTPKGLLRLREAASTLADLAEGSFQPVLDDPGADRDRSAPARPLLGQGLLRHRRARAARRRRESRRRPSRAAVSRSRGRARGARRLLPRAGRGRLGPGGAAEHGRVALDPAPARGGAAVTAFRSATSAGPGGRARARATRPRTCASRTGSPARRWASRLALPRAGRRRVLRGAGHPGCDQRAVSPRVREQGLALPRRKAKPDVVGREREADGASGSTQSRHTSILTYGHVHPLSGLQLSQSRPNNSVTIPHRSSSPANGGSYAGRDDVAFQSGDSGASRAQAPQLGARRCHAALELRARGSVRQPSTLQDRRSRPGWRRRWTASSRSSRSRRWCIPGRARTRSSTSMTDQSLWGRSRDFDWGD